MDGAKVMTLLVACINVQIPKSMVAPLLKPSLI
jgi:hypothetical protein